MRKLIVSESLTLDGVFQCPAKSTVEDFKYAGWTEPYNSKEQMERCASDRPGACADDSADR